jgi:hypothetical protein
MAGYRTNGIGLNICRGTPDLASSDPISQTGLEKGGTWPTSGHIWLPLRDAKRILPVPSRHRIIDVPSATPFIRGRHDALREELVSGSWIPCEGFFRG